MPANHLLQGHHHFQAKHLESERHFLLRLASEGQSPDSLFIGCSDSRVVPEVLTASSPGALFVVRNVGNQVPPLEHVDASVGAAIEYAVGHLHVGHILVCGHTGCGAVLATLDGIEQLHGLPSLTEWLLPLQAPVERARALGGDRAETWERAVEENVIQQLWHLLSFGPVIEALDAGTLELHGWVYDIHSLGLRVYDSEAKCFVPSSQMVAPG